MPRDITHIILADEAAKVAQSKDIADNPNAFHMGCVADDAFLYSFSPQLSSQLHGKDAVDTRAIILEMMEELKKEEDPAKYAEKKAFICGCLCHMAADVIFHPLIYSISGAHQVEENDRSKKMMAKACHRYAETWLDLYLMRKKKISFKSFKPFRKIVASIGMRVRLDDFFTDCVQRVLKAKKYTWGDNFDLQAQFHNSMTRQFFVDKITQSQTIARMIRTLDKGLNGKLKLYTSGFYDFDGDIPQRLTSGSYVHPVTGENVHKTLDDLEKEAVEASVKYIQSVDAYLKCSDREAFENSVKNFNLDTGTENGSVMDFNKKIVPDMEAMEVKNAPSNAKTKPEAKKLPRTPQKNHGGRVA